MPPRLRSESLCHHHHLHEEEYLQRLLQEDPVVVLLLPRVPLRQVPRVDQDQVVEHALFTINFAWNSLCGTSALMLTSPLSVQYLRLPLHLHGQEICCFRPGHRESAPCHSSRGDLGRAGRVRSEPAGLEKPQLLGSTDGGIAMPAHPFSEVGAATARRLAIGPSTSWTDRALYCPSEHEPGD